MVCGRRHGIPKLKVCLKCQGSTRSEIQSSFFYEGKLASWMKRSKENGLRPYWSELFKMDIPFPFDPSVREIAYVPSDPVQTQKRGYDSSRELAKVLSRKWDLHLIDSLFIRKSFLILQKQMNEKDRAKWLRECLSLNADKARGVAKVGIVDDLATTGSSLRFCEEILGQAGIHSELYSLFREC